MPNRDRRSSCTLALSRALTWKLHELVAQADSLRLEFVHLIATLWGQAFWPAAALSGGVAQADSLRPMVNLLAMKPKLREANQRSPAGYQPAPQAQRESHALTAVELFVNRGAANAR